MHATMFPKEPVSIASKMLYIISAGEWQRDFTLTATSLELLCTNERHAKRMPDVQLSAPAFSSIRNNLSARQMCHCPCLLQP